MYIHHALYPINDIYCFVLYCFTDTNTTPNEAMMLPIVVIAGAGGGAVVVIALLAILICIVCM